jgi:large subunit ribosomal protein L4
MLARSLRRSCVANSLVSNKQIELHLLADAPVVRQPGDLVDIKALIRNWSTIPAVGFNSILKLPVKRFERLIDAAEQSTSSVDALFDEVIVPNDVFGVPLRKDIAFRVYQYHRRALAGYQETMQLYKWEWVGRNAKHRNQLETGRSRMGRRKAPGKYEGVFAHPLRPKDWRQGINRRMVYQGLKIMLSAKFAQGQITVVDSFNVGSHKTKHVASHLRNLLGTRCNSALLVHEGNRDVNDNFRWGCAHLPQVRRENVEGVNVYTLAKYREIVITEKALRKLIYKLQEYPRLRGWIPVNATPDRKPASVPKMVEGWNDEWLEKRRKLQQSEFRGKLLNEERRKWKWSSSLKGPLKVPAQDPLRGFRVKNHSLFEESVAERVKKFEFQELFADDEPIGDDQDGFSHNDDEEPPIDLAASR